MKSYTEVTLSFNKLNYVALCNFLYKENINSFLEENNSLKIYFPEKDSAHLFQFLTNLLLSEIVLEEDISVSPLKDINWQKRWEDSIGIINIENKILIYPSWKSNEVKKFKDKILIRIEPKMSFGTGQDTTTQLMLKMMCRYITPDDKKMLDYGCGTTILSIAGIKLGLKKATAIDIDADSIRDAGECIKLNNTDRKIKLIKSELNQLKENDFDIIAANINTDIISKNLNLMKSKLSVNGKLFLSGIPRKDEFFILKKIKRYNFKIIKKFTNKDWLAFYLIKA